MRITSPNSRNSLPRAISELSSMTHYATGSSVVWLAANDTIQKRLLSEEKITFDRACKLAHSMTTAIQDTQELNRASTVQVNKISKPPTRPKKHSGTPKQTPQHQPRSHQPRRPCYRCGSTEHRDHDCHHKDSVCHFCKKKGHIESICFAKKRQQHQVKSRTPLT